MKARDDVISNVFFFLFLFYDGTMCLVFCEFYDRSRRRIYAFFFSFYLGIFCFCFCWVGEGNGVDMF